MCPALEVVEPGLMTTVQDFGRYGHQAQGVPVSGALDPGSLRLANALVGNDQGAGGLEIRVLGPTLKVVSSSVRVALCGTDCAIEFVGERRVPVASNRSVLLQKGQIIRIGHVSDSAVCYLAVEGGFDLPPLYGSQSTYLAGKMGGFEGRALQKGDCLKLARDVDDVEIIRLCPEPFLPSRTGKIRVVLGPQDDYFGTEAITGFLSQTYRISQEANRMGVRLLGEPIGHLKGADINSDGIVTGSIQIPGNGLPIILLADHQTTGGYPKIATVIRADVARLGRMVPGSELSFLKVGIEDAEEAAIAQDNRIRQAIASIVSVTGEDGLYDYMLQNSNLVCGAVAE
ncbi:biotin-dependent carboxyltransferase family protein [uncultured Cohaesibacter sp.]|uniref:5-oxoprolinase subunit C family protein n=1 Tax=uncultured Cohaesibacter sp. TaxID=1002546 RepID=UPI00292CB69E|nr:biotin-dependent carboxyltransferase family protein [uncultured Cohaesibacter sp.]